MKIINDILKDKEFCKLKGSDDSDRLRVNEGEMRDNNCNLIGNKRGQLSIFVIIALVIAAGVIIYLAVSGKIGGESVPAEFAPIYEYYASCIDEKAREAIDLASSQGGHIYLPAYTPGSDYAPFSNHLNFLGFPVPYWLYVSGNGLVKEQIPSKKDIEGEIARYLESRLGDCDFEQFYSKGFSIEFGNAEASASIQDDKVIVNLNQPVSSEKEGNSARKTSQTVEVPSKFGKLYQEARDLYDEQKKEAFLENYALDVLRLYAPVDGVEISCNGKIWKSREVAEEIKSGLEGNIQSLKVEGDYYTLSNDARKYFVIPSGKTFRESVRFLYDKNWPSKIEIHGTDEELMIAEPVGNQEGLGILGFCYSPYHFVYDLSFPVLVQIGEGQETFQFPVTVIVDKNTARQGLYSENNETVEEYDVCSSMNKDLEVELLNNNLENVDGTLSYSCFNQRCRLGETEGGKWKGKAPACLNGYLEARAEGFADKKELVSTNSESKAEIILDREYEEEVDLEIDGKKLDGNAIVTFAGEKTRSVALPESSKLKLSEGSYNVSVFVYGNSSLQIPGSKKEQCTEILSSGFLGFFGGTREECFEIEIPGMKLDYALIGGGKEEHYLLESELEKGKMKIKVNGLPKPDSVEQLQNNFEAFEGMGVDIEYG